jgi:opacity protein-like surface antigen
MSSGTSDRGDQHMQAKGLQMRFSTLLAAALLAMTNAAVADGLGSGSSNRCCEVATWSGVYAGFQAGGAWSDTGWTFPFADSFSATPGQRFSTNLDGALVGGQLGINQQIGRLLLGAELSVAGTSTHDTQIGPAGFAEDRLKTSASSLLTATSTSAPYRIPRSPALPAMPTIARTGGPPARAGSTG